MDTRTWIIQPGYGFIDWNIREVTLTDGTNYLWRIARTGKIERLLDVSIMTTGRAWESVHAHGKAGDRVRVHYLSGTSKDLTLKPLRDSGWPDGSAEEPDDVRAERIDAAALSALDMDRAIYDCF